MPVQGRAPTSPIFDELRGIQRTHGYLPGAELRALADRIGVPLFHVQGVASFDPAFFLTPPARAEVRVCCDMACHRRGGSDLQEHLRARFRTADVNVEHASCLGRCDLAPALAVNAQIFEQVSESGAASLVEAVLDGASPGDLAARAVPSRRSPIECDPYPDRLSQYGILRSYVHSKDWPGLI